MTAQARPAEGEKKIVAHTPPPLVPYSIGTNCAGETSGQVANYLLADLRVFMIGNNAGQMMCDRLQSGIVGALRESAIAAKLHATTSVVIEPTNNRGETGA